MELGYYQAPVNQHSFNDGWYRTFKGVPDFSSAVKKTLREYIDKGQYSRVMIFFISKCGYEADYAGFLLRELIEGEDNES